MDWALVKKKIVSVLLSASVERVSVSRMRDFFNLFVSMSSDFTAALLWVAHPTTPPLDLSTAQVKGLCMAACWLMAMDHNNGQRNWASFQARQWPWGTEQEDTHRKHIKRRIHLDCSCNRASIWQVISWHGQEMTSTVGAKKLLDN